MKKTFEQFLLAASLLLFSALCTSSALQGVAQTAAPNAQLAGRELNAKVEALLKKMTLEEKIGQTVQYSAGFATGPAGSKVSYDGLTQRGEVGSLLNVDGAERANHYQSIAMEKSRVHV